MLANARQIRVPPANIERRRTRTYVPTQEHDIRLLVDDHPDPACWPTRGNIVANIHWLVDHSQAGDDLFFHFSGGFIVFPLRTRGHMCRMSQVPFRSHPLAGGPGASR